MLIIGSLRGLLLLWIRGKGETRQFCGSYCVYSGSDIERATPNVRIS